MNETLAYVVPKAREKKVRHVIEEMLRVGEQLNV